MDFNNFSTNPTSPALDAFVITPSATALAVRPRAIIVGGDGDLVVTTQRGTTLTIKVVIGQQIDLVVSHVLASTTATNLIGLV